MAQDTAPLSPIVNRTAVISKPRQEAVCFDWTIHQLSLLTQANGEYIESPPFSLGSALFVVRLFPRNIKHAEPKRMSVHLCVHRIVEPVHVVVKMQRKAASQPDDAFVYFYLLCIRISDLTSQSVWLLATTSGILIQHVRDSRCWLIGTE
jgi:hypothetical protein